MKRLPARIWFRRLHLVLGLALGAVLVVVAGSGAALVFRNEIREMGAPAVTSTWDGTSNMGFPAARDLARSHRPGYTLQALWFPNRIRPFYEAAFARDGVTYTAFLRFHPATGGLMPIEKSPVLEWLEEVHVDLHLGEAGAFLVRWCTLLFSLMLLSGLYLWWPGSKPHLWLAIRRGRLRLWDAHRVLGFVCIIPLLSMLVSGVVFAFPAASAAIYWLTGATPPAAIRDPSKLKSSLREGGEGVDASDEALLASAIELSPADSFIFYITFPTKPDNARQVRLQRGYDPVPYGEVHRIYFDRYTGEVLSHMKPDDGLASRYISTLNSQLHFGTLLGPANQILWMIASGLVPFFAVSGIVLWRCRARRGGNRPA